MHFLIPHIPPHLTPLPAFAHSEHIHVPERLVIALPQHEGSTLFKPAWMRKDVGGVWRTRRGDEEEDSGRGREGGGV